MGRRGRAGRGIVGGPSRRREVRGWRGRACGGPGRGLILASSGAAGPNGGGPARPGAAPVLAAATERGFGQVWRLRGWTGGRQVGQRGRLARAARKPGWAGGLG